MTPGPWIVLPHSICVAGQHEAQNALVANCASLRRTQEECRANAIAVAALPDLLAAAWNAAEELYQHEGDNAAACRQDLLAAIAKAEGRTP